VVAASSILVAQKYNEASAAECCHPCVPIIAAGDLNRNISAAFLLFQSNGTWPVPLYPMIRQATCFTGSWPVHFKIRTQLAP
jgi:hypothetical protein